MNEQLIISACAQAAKMRAMQIALLHPGQHVDPVWLGEEIAKSIAELEGFAKAKGGAA